jgi:cell division protein FtsQ
MARSEAKKLPTRPRASAAPKRPSATGIFLRQHRGLLRGAAIGLVLLGAIGAGAAGVAALDPVSRARDAAALLASMGRGPGLAVREIRIEGREFTPREALLGAIGILPGEAILDFDPQAAKARLEEIAWVADAHVERHLDGTILVRLQERRAFAVWQRDGRFSVIDREGRIMATERLEAFGPLPLVVGAGAEREAAAMIDLLRSSPEIADRVQALVRVSERRWNMRLHNGADVMLPEGQEEAAIVRLTELQARERLLDRPLAAVDMRLPDRLVLRMQPPGTQAPPPRSTRG